MKRIHPTQAEIDAGTIFIKSDLWPVSGAGVVWTVSHASGWSAQGRSADIEAAQAEIERRADAALDVVVAETLRVNRILNDGPGEN